MPKTLLLRSLTLLLIIIALPSCTTETPTDVAPLPDPGEPHIIPSGFNLVWPELSVSELCPPEVVQPEIEFCLLNDGTGFGVVPDNAHLLFPAGAAPGMAQAVLDSLPMGNWGIPMPINVSGLPGEEGEIEGIAFTQIPTGTDEASLGMIFVCTPTLGGCDQGLLIFKPTETEGASQGLWIGAPDLTGHSHVMGIVMEDKPGEEGAEGIIVIDSMPALPGESEGIIIVSGSPSPNEDSEGIIIVSGLPGPESDAEGIIIIDSKPGKEWGARGIIVVDSIPGPGESAEGIIVVDTMPGDVQLSQVLSVMMESVPGQDGSEGIIVVDTIPFSDVGTDDFEWGGLVVSLEKGAQGESQAVLLGAAPSSGEVGINGNNLPFGFDPESMMAMMGEGGFGPGPMLIGKLNLEPLSSKEPLEPGEQDCIWPQISLNLGGSGGVFPAESFFDVTIDLTAGMPTTDDSGELETRRFPVRTPPYGPCTPTPALVDVLPTATPTPREVIPPTPTVRTGNPTNTPGGRSAPTATPGR